MTSPRDIANRIPITGALMLATLMNTLDSTIANVALPHIQGSVSAAQDQITWVLTSYIIATAIMTPLSGWLSERFGRKRMFLLSILGFTVASMLCGVATNLPEIVLFRLLQGIAGASMMPLSQTVMLDIFPPQQVPRVMALWSSAVIVGPILGPALGGWLTDNLSWRWVFYINVPIGILAFVGLSTFMDDDAGGRQRPFDALGFTALVAFVGGLQLMADRGPGQDWFHSPEICAYGMTVLIGLWVFVTQVMTSKNPFFHRDLMRDRNFATSTIISFFIGGLMFSTTALLPTMMQSLMGYSVLQAGYASMPRGIGSLCAFLLIPMLMSMIGARRVLLTGLAVSSIAVFLMTRFSLDMTSSSIMVSGVIQGFGTGMMFAPLSILAFATLSPTHRVEGTIVNTMARSLGSSVGISAVQAMLVRQSASVHSLLAGNIQPSDPVISSALQGPLNPGIQTGLMALNGEITRQGAMVAYDWVFSSLLLASLVIVPLLLIMRPPPPIAAPAHEMVGE